MELAEIKRRLRRGELPETFAQLVGRGAQNKAYRIGNWIVKRHVGAWNCGRQDKSNTPHRKLWFCGFMTPEQYYVSYGGNDYVIQEFIRPCTMQEHGKIPRETHRRASKMHFDLHGGNFGVNSKGWLTAFDW